MKNVSIGVLENRESEVVSPHKLCLQKIAFELRLGFENLEIYTLQALWERYTDLPLAMGKHLGHIEAIKSQMQGELQFVPQLIPREPLLIFPLISASEIVQLLKKSADEPPGSEESKSVLNITTMHISESEYMLYWYHVALKVCKETVSSNSCIQ